MGNIITGNDIIKFLKGLSIKESTRDYVLNGDSNKIVKKIAVVFLLTVDILKKCINENIDMIIVHEGIFYNEPSYQSSLIDEIAIRKNELLMNSHILVYRFHDVPHNLSQDLILDGFLKELNLGIQSNDCYNISFGVNGVRLKEKIETKKIVKIIKKKLRLKKVRFYGDIDSKINNISFGLGQCIADYSNLSKTDCELFICGELYDLPGGSYCSDAKSFGIAKSIICLGHYTSEYLGMKYFTDFLQKNFSGLDVNYFDCGEFFKYL